MYMKLSLYHLRTLIAEALLNEMPFLGKSQLQIGPDRGRSDIRTNQPVLAQKNQKAVGRFFDSPKFKNDAIKLYNNLAVPIYVVPIWEGLVNVGDRNMNVRSQDLVKMGFSKEKIEEFIDMKNSGAAVFIVSASSLESGFLPTPWMIIHALFDDGDPELSTIPSMTNYKDRLSELVSSIVPVGRRQFAQQSEQQRQRYVRLLKGLTMRSARETQIFTLSDFISEIITQSVATKSGFTYKSTGDEEIDVLLEQIQALMIDAKREFEKAIAGKIIYLKLWE